MERRIALLTGEVLLTGGNGERNPVETGFITRSQHRP